MQSNQNDNVDNGEKSLAEWPTLGDVCSNVKQSTQNGDAAKSSRLDQKRGTSPTDNVEGDDSAKENDDSTRQVNSRGARKKGSRQKWLPVPIVTPPYRKRYERGNGRPVYEQSRGNHTVNLPKKNESSENINGNENRKSRNRFKGRRGQGISNNWRSPEELSHGELNGHPVNYYNGYFDQHTHNHYLGLSSERDHIIMNKLAIQKQIEYYFSEENLVKDFFMRRRMDANGYVSLTLVASFNRVQRLSLDIQLIIEAINESDKLEVLNNEKLRPVVDPLKWPMHDCSSLRPDVPDFVPGQQYVTSSKIVEAMQGCSLGSPDSVAENIPNGDVIDDSQNSACMIQNNGDVIDDSQNNSVSMIQNNGVMEDLHNSSVCIIQNNGVMDDSQNNSACTIQNNGVIDDSQKNSVCEIQNNGVIDDSQNNSVCMLQKQEDNST